MIELHDLRILFGKRTGSKRDSLFFHSALHLIDRHHCARQGRPDQIHCSHIQCQQIAAPSRSALKAVWPDSSDRHCAFPPPKTQEQVSNSKCVER